MFVYFLSTTRSGASLSDKRELWRRLNLISMFAYIVSALNMSKQCLPIYHVNLYYILLNCGRKIHIGFVIIQRVKSVFHRHLENLLIVKRIEAFLRNFLCTKFWWDLGIQILTKVIINTENTDLNIYLEPALPYELLLLHGNQLKLREKLVSSNIRCKFENVSKQERNIAVWQKSLYK